MTTSHTFLFADSEVSAVTAVATGIHIRLSAAHVLFRGDSDTDKPTEGFSRGIEILLPGAKWTQSALTGFMGRISEARLCTGSTWSSNVLLPCRVSMPIRLEMAFANQSFLELTATGLECRFEGDANFSESLFC